MNTETKTETQAKKLTLEERYPDGINSMSPGARELGAGETPTCPHCGKPTPFEGLILPFSDNVIWLREVRTPCECKGAQKERADAEIERQRKEQEEAKRIIELRRQKSGIGAREALNRFDNYTETETNSHAFKAAKRYAAAVASGKVKAQKMNSLFIYGSIGTGKTHLASAIANELIEGGNRGVRFTKYADLCREIRKTYEKENRDTEEEILQRYRDCGLLIIDDLGKEKPTEWSTAILYDIIDYRYRNLLPCVITSNFSLENAALKLTAGEDSCAQAIVDRLYEAFFPVQVLGTSWRTMKPKNPF